MGMKTFSPSWYFQGEVTEEARQEISRIFKDFIEDKDNFGQPPKWTAPVRSSYDHMNNEKAPWQAFFKIVGSQFEKFLDEVGTLQDVEVLPLEAWVNKYRPGDSQEYHTHCGPDVNIAMVYFHTITDNDDCKFMFYNNDHDYQLTGLVDVLKIPNTQHTIPNVKEGSIIIFPSFYPHLVSIHKGIKNRVTFSSNLQVVPVGMGATCQNMGPRRS